MSFLGKLISSHLKEEKKEKGFDDTAFYQRKGNLSEMPQTAVGNTLFYFFTETYLAFKTVHTVEIHC